MPQIAMGSASEIGPETDGNRPKVSEDYFSEACSPHGAAHDYKPSEPKIQDGSINLLESPAQLCAAVLDGKSDSSEGDEEDIEDDLVSLKNNIALLRESLPQFKYQDRVEALNELGSALRDYFEIDGDGSALDEAIELHRKALEMCLEDYEGRSVSLNNLSNSLAIRFEQSGDITALDESIQLGRLALQLRPVGHLGRPISLTNLASSLTMLFEQKGDRLALSEAIDYNREALGLFSPGDSNRASCLSNLANALSIYFEQTGEIKILEESIKLDRESLDLRPQGHKERINSLGNLANSLQTYYNRAGDASALKEAIAYIREALELCPPSHHLHSLLLNDLGTSLRLGYETLGDLDGLTESIALHRKALSLRPGGHPDRGMSLNNLASSLSAHFNQSGDLSTLNEIVDLRREAVQLRPIGHPLRASALNGLAGTLRMAFDWNGKMSLLSEAIELYREALDYCPTGHYARSDILSNLADSLMYYSQQVNDIVTLHESINKHREALSLRPDGHPRRAVSFSNLASSLRVSFEQTGDASFLNEAIGYHNSALDLRLEGHPDRPSSLKNLASALLSYYRVFNDKSALLQCIDLYREVLRALPIEHPRHAAALHHLADSILSSFGATGDEDSLNEVLSLEHRSLQERKDDHPQRHLSYFTMAKVRLLQTSLFDWNAALTHLASGVKDKNASSKSRLNEIVHVLELVEDVTMRCVDESYLHSSTVLDVYSATIDLLPLVAHLGLDYKTRLRELSKSTNLARIASFRAVSLNYLCLAVELFEQGKGIFWQQALRMRSPDLTALPGDDSAKLSRMLRVLESENQGFGDIEDRAELEKKMNHRRKLGEEVEKFIEEIRLRPGLERFLRTPDVERLLQAAKDGPIVILVDSTLGCMAIVISFHWPEKIKTVTLPSATNSTLRTLSQAQPFGLRNATSEGLEQAETLNDRGLGISKVQKVDSPSAPLAVLWSLVVEPVIKVLGLRRAEGRRRPRMFWIPSGVFTSLPLHAAGVFEPKKVVSLADYAVSSYVPSISALLKARQGFSPVLRKDVRAMVAFESDAPDLPHLTGVKEEAETVAGLITAASAMVVNDINATPTTQSVQEHAQNAHILHLSCHGEQRPDPLESYFALKDGPLAISSLMTLDLPHALLAFLSACQTAKGSKEQSDEAVHLAGSMLFCGFRSVVATMWEMHDDDGPLVAQWFYEELLKSDTIELDDVAYAIDYAIQRLRARVKNPKRWATFMHMGT